MQPGKNDYRADDFFSKCEEYGKRIAAGEDALPQLYIDVIQGAYDGYLDLQKDKHGQNLDDAMYAYTRAMTSKSGAAVFKGKADSLNSQASRVRSILKVGLWTRGGTGQPIERRNKLVNVWSKLATEPHAKGRRVSLAEALIKFARVQVKRDAILTDEELQNLCLRPAKADLTLADWIERTCVKPLRDLRNGKANRGQLSDQSEAIRDSLEALVDRVTELRGKDMELEEPRREISQSEADADLMAALI